MTPIPRLVVLDQEFHPNNNNNNDFATHNNNENHENTNMVITKNKSNHQYNNVVVQKRRSDDNKKMSFCSSALLPKGKTCQYHTPPSDAVDYNDNDTVFGKILRGEAPALILAESRDLLAFQDIHPRAPLHALIIPKRFIENIASLTPDDVPLLQDMHDMAVQLLQQHHPTALAQHDYILCFHVPPFTSVSHLHLHVLAPASQMKLYYRKVKYTAETRWCTSFDRVLQRLQEGQSSSPYFALPSIHYDS